MDDLVGRTLGPYQILSEIGHGGMANVYLASQPSVGREVAIKVLPFHFLQDRTFLERFNREIKVIAHLQHPRILPVYDSGEENGQPYIVMAYVPGGTLADRIKSFPNGMPLKEVVRLIEQIAEGLDYAHEQGIIHRDFKPSNVLIDRKGNVYLADFGIARVIADVAESTGRGMVGTPHYMAPEISQGAESTPSADVYALGVTLYEMATGVHPYEAETPIAVILAHVNQPIPNARSIRPRLPSAVQQVIAWAMAKDPADRPRSAGDLAQLLERAMSIAGPDTAVIPAPAGADVTVMRMPGAPSPGTMEDGEAIPTPMDEPGAASGPASGEEEAMVSEPSVIAPQSRRFVLPLLVIAGAGVFLVGGAAALSLLLASAVKVSSGSPTPLQTALSPAVTAVAHNADWKPVLQTFDSVEMVEVPPGCFDMGNDSGDNERPMHQQCFDRPFWIDRTEITNAEFTRLGGEAASAARWTADNQPREQISWVEADAFCQKRGAHLPTEAEWEFAARGPDDLIYPWGNSFDPDKVVFAKNSGGQTAAVGSKLSGASWVGALDMSGNVYEWVSSIFRPYPFDPADGRESESDRTHTRVARGGSWATAAMVTLSTPFRSGADPLSTNDAYGFRCARSN